MRVSLGMMAAVPALVSVTVPVWADDEAVPIRELPRAVREAVEKGFPRAEFKRAERETDDGRTVFEVTLAVDEGQRIDMDLTPDGKVLEIEQNISVARLREAVRKTLTRKFPGAEVDVDVEYDDDRD